MSAGKPSFSIADLYPARVSTLRENENIGNVTELKGVKVNGPQFDYSELIVLMNLVDSKLISYGYEKYVVELLTLLMRLEKHLVTIKEVDNLETILELKDAIYDVIGLDAKIGVKKRNLKAVIALYKGRIESMATPPWAIPGHIEGGTRRSTKHNRKQNRKHNRSNRSRK